MSIISSTQLEIPVEDPVFPYENIISYIPFEEDLNLVSNSDLLAYFPFDSNSQDISGNGYTGVVTGATQAAGYVNNGYLFYGSSDINYGNILPLIGGGSISFWVNAGDYGTIIEKGSYKITLENDGIHLFINTIEVAVSTPLRLNYWTFVCITFDNSSKKIYINGKLSVNVSNNTLPNANTNDFII